jgi:uncharacterized membrane protein
MDISPKIIAFMAVPVVAAIGCFVLPRWISRIIVILDALWVTLLLAIFSGCNPEGPAWGKDNFTVVFTVISALPLLYEVFWWTRKIFKPQPTSAGDVATRAAPEK